MTVARVQHIYHGKSNLPRDQYVTTWHFAQPDGPGGSLTGVSPSEALDLVAAVENFYTVATGQTKAMLHYHAFPGFAPVHTSYKVYNLSQPQPRVPVYVGPPVAQSATNAAPTLPGEVAVCLSYNAVPVAGIPAGRRRGRIFLGPLNTNAMIQAADGHCRPEPMILSDAKIAAKRMRAAALGTGGWYWGVYSPTQAAVEEESPGDPGWGDATAVSTDDAFDTQRRRGIAPLARTSLSVLP